MVDDVADLARRASAAAAQGNLDEAADLAAQAQRRADDAAVDARRAGCLTAGEAPRSAVLAMAGPRRAAGAVVSGAVAPAGSASLVQHSPLRAAGCPEAGAQAAEAQRLAREAAAAAANITAANFAQRTASRSFSSGGRFAGQTIDGVAAQLRAGTLAAKDVPIDVIIRDGNTLILNTRSAQALQAAGVPRSAWNVVNRTGDAAFESRLTGQLTRNGLDSTGIDSVRITGR